MIKLTDDSSGAIDDHARGTGGLVTYREEQEPHGEAALQRFGLGLLVELIPTVPLRRVGLLQPLQLHQFQVIGVCAKTPRLITAVTTDPK